MTQDYTENDDLQDLLSRLAHTAHAGTQLGIHERRSLETVMEASLAHVEQLKAYMGTLQQVLGEHDEDWNALDSGDLQRVLEEGLSELGDTELAELALNPIALWGLHDAIYDDMPRAWFDKVAAAGGGITRYRETDWSAAPRILTAPTDDQVERAGVVEPVTPSRKRRFLRDLPRWFQITCVFVLVFLVGSACFATYVLQTDRRAQRELHQGFLPESGLGETTTSAEEVPPVTCTIGNAVVHHPEFGRPIINYIGTNDARALSTVFQTIARLGGDTSRLAVTTTAELAAKGREVEGNEIIIGGPRVAASRFRSVVAKLYGVADSLDPDGLERGFRFKARNIRDEERSCFLVESEKLGIEDASTGKTCLVQYDQSDRTRVVVDAALIIRGHVDGRDLLVIAGFDYVGTLHAAQFLSKPSPELTAFNAKFEETGLAELVIRVEEEEEPVVFFGPRGR